MLQLYLKNTALTPKGPPDQSNVEIITICTYLTVHCRTAVLEHVCRKRKEKQNITKGTSGCSEFQCKFPGHSSVIVKKRVWTQNLLNYSVRYKIRALLHLTQAPFNSRTESKTRQATNSATQRLTIAVFMGLALFNTQINGLTLLQSESLPQRKSYMCLYCVLTVRLVF